MKYENRVNLFIGKSKDWEYIFLEKAFNDDGWFSWLTGNSFEFKTERQKERDEDNYFSSDNSDIEYLFSEYIKWSHDWDTSLNEWIDMVKDEHPNWASYDDSYCDEEWLQEAMKYASEKEWYDYEYSDCRGGWRMFDDENTKEDYYEYFIPENLKLLQEQYKEFEKSN